MRVTIIWMFTGKETHRAEACLVNEKVSFDTGEGEVFLSKPAANDRRGGGGRAGRGERTGGRRRGNGVAHPLHRRGRDTAAHIFVAFMAYCLQVTLKHRMRALAPGLTPRTVLEKMAALQMVDMHLPTTDGRCLVLSRHTQPEKD